MMRAIRAFFGVEPKPVKPKERLLQLKQEEKKRRLKKTKGKTRPKPGAAEASKDQLDSIDRRTVSFAPNPTRHNYDRGVPLTKSISVSTAALKPAKSAMKRSQTT